MSITQYSNSHTLTLDIKKSIAVASQIPTYIQNDTAELLIKLLNNGQPYDYSTADRYVINFKRPDGLMVNGIGTYENGFIKYNLGSSEREIVGSVETSVSLFLGTSRISTRPFMIRVLKDYEEGIPSQEGFSVLQELFIEVDAVKTSAETATANANNAASKITEFTYKGDYVSGVAYKQSNVVTYGGVNYLAIQNSTSIIPTDANYWKQVAPSVTNNSQTWTATAGQKTFTITNGSYVVGKGNIQVWVGGVFQTGFTESSETTISFSEAVPTGTTVYAKWFEGALSITKGHKTGHEVGGQDELDVTKLKNYDVIMSQLAEKATKTELTNALVPKTDKTYVDSQLELKRSKTELISGADIDISNDSKKIGLTQLNDAARAAIAGTAAVNAVPSPQGINNTHLAPSAVSFEKTDFVVRGKNLFNYATRNLGKLVQHYDGTLATLSSYDTSDYIPVKAGTNYAVNQCRKIAVYDTNKTYVTGYDVNPDGFKTITVASDGFIRVAFGTSYVTTAQVEVGTVSTSYEAFSLQIPLQITDGKSIKDKSISVFKLADGIIDNPITIVKSGINLSVTSKIDTNDLKINTTIGGGNNLFNFVDTYYGADKIHIAGDDITPIRTFYTIGANHGYPTVKITMAGHGKTIADVGSIWTDGTRQYTILQISGNDLVFNFPYTYVNSIVSYTEVFPSSSLTHVSGATNTTSISITTMVKAQLYPSVNNVSRKFLLDGKEITADGTYIGRELQVQESYNIMCYKEIIDYIQSHIGGTISNDIISGAVRLSINYVFGDKGTCTVHHNFRALKKLSIGDCGFIQSYKISLSNHNLFKYIPNTKSKSGFDFKTPVDVTNWNTLLFLEKTDYVDPNIPINRMVTWLQDSSTNQKKVGFTMGYVIDKSNTKHVDRVANSTRGIELASTGKNYPVAMNGQTFNPGDYKNFICYRNYLSPLAKANATNFTIVKDKKDTYIYIDYHTNVSFENIKLDEHIGKVITVLEKNSDFTLHNDIVDPDGVSFTVINNYGYAILKLS